MIRVGILGTARIARALFTAPLHNASIVAIASREKSAAEAFGSEFGIPRRYGSYDQLLDDNEVDAVYIPLPQHLHCEYTVKAARAGKHVLVEKPAALTSNEVREMNNTCRAHSVYLMEAFMYRFKSAVKRIREIVASGEIGTLNLINFNWSFNIRRVRRGAFRTDPALGGGSMYDLGIYGIDFVRYMTGAEPEIVHSTLYRETPDGADMMAHVEYRSGNTTAVCTSGLLTDANLLLLGGSLGSITARAGLAGNVVENSIQVHLLEGDKLREERFGPENPYVAELDYFADGIKRKSAPQPDGENSLKNLQIIEAVFAGAENRLLSH
jgi:D-xylose 1-dehydrogenase (NADP+, D-xylono-1,5-lactone-forming)